MGLISKAEEPIDTHWTVTVVALAATEKQSRVIVVSSLFIMPKF